MMNSTLRSVLLVAVLAGLLTGCGDSSSQRTAADDGANEVKGDPVRGEQLYEQCAACHTLQANAAGPMHCGVFGRPAGSVADFDYSQAMKDSGLVWNVQALDEFLTSPFTYVSGTKMGFAGFSDPSDRADVIAYLYKANHDPALCPTG